MYIECNVDQISVRNVLRGNRPICHYFQIKKMFKLKFHVNDDLHKMSIFFIFFKSMKKTNETNLDDIL